MYRYIFRFLLQVPVVVLVQVQVYRCENLVSASTSQQLTSLAGQPWGSTGVSFQPKILGVFLMVPLMFC